MSSAANQKREPLEEEFWRRMHDAEASPSADLWARIDHDLTVQENAVYKNRVVFYRQLAAACFVLFVLAGALSMYYFSKDEQQQQLAIAPQQTATLAIAAAPQTKAESVPASIAQSATLPGVAPEIPEIATAPRQASARTTTAKSARTAPARTAPVYMAAATAPAIPTDRVITSSQNPSNAFTVSLGAEQMPLERVITGQGHTFTDLNSHLLSERGEGTAAFKSLQPFYQLARQAIAAVPDSYSSAQNMHTSLAAQQLLRNPAYPQGAAQAVQGLRAAIASENRLPQHQQEALVLALNGGKADKKDSGSSENSRWTVGMAYAPSYFDQNIGIPEQAMSMASMRSFSLAGPSVNALAPSEMNKAREEYADNTDPGFSYAFEAKVGFKLFKKLKLLTGIGYSQNSARTKSSYIIQQYQNHSVFDSDVALAPSTVFLPSLTSSVLVSDSVSVAKTDAFNVNYRYRHLTLPVGLQYEGRLSKDWFWYAGSGVAANFLLQTTVMASTNEVSDVTFNRGDASPFRKVQLSGNVSVGVGKRLSNAISVAVGPEFRGYFNTLLATPEDALAPQGKPYTIGLNMAVNYDLGSGRK
ncbi:outer membrane beta-barrel protein [Pontibacter chitinilyticus]|uniref:outer membrane beta-barrel protein n=1 Tax=Pontibacter chitinilyticus TaxID=2674989 RepID=UPI00321ABDBC